MEDVIHEVIKRCPVDLCSSSDLVVGTRKGAGSWLEKKKEGCSEAGNLEVGREVKEGGRGEGSTRQGARYKAVGWTRAIQVWVKR